MKERVYEIKERPTPRQSRSQPRCSCIGICIRIHRIHSSRRRSHRHYEL